MSDTFENIIYTIGHSTHTEGKFISMLRHFEIETLVDIRAFPGSKRYPHFNLEAVKNSLKKAHIHYIHKKDLGGRRKPVKGSANTTWRNDAFRGYADYMETEPFIQAIEGIEKLAVKERVAYMCSEALWWRCHRALVSDYLKSKGWKVMHIMNEVQTKEHPYTAAARMIDGVLKYSEPGLF